MKKGFKHINEKEFATIKKLLELGLKTNMIKDITGRSGSAIGGIAKHDTLQGYREACRAQRAQSGVKQSREEVQQVDEAISDHQMSQVLQNINDSLVNIDQRLKFIEEHTEVPTPRKLWR